MGQLLAPLVSPRQLLGTWDLARRLVDRRLGRFGRVEGTLTLSSDGDDVRWLERGRLSWDGSTHDVGRELRIVGSAGGWRVCFADGRPFHDWVVGTPLIHPCRADTYSGLLDVDRELTQLRVLWDVTGPAKDQRIFSRCRRRPRGAPTGAR